MGRRSPTIINAAYGEIFMWDGRAASLEEQALGPIKTEGVMNCPLGELIERLKSCVSDYGPLFQSAFPNAGIAEGSVAKAIATCERTIVPRPRAPLDGWIEGDEQAIPDAAKRGFVLFNTKARCSLCHSGWRFTDDSFNDTGLPDADIGRGSQMPAVVKMQHAFKTPGLREITERGPYMHDGALPTLAAVVEHYRDGGVERPSRSDLIKPLDLSDRDQADLVAFMQTLSSDLAPTTVPTLPRKLTVRSMSNHAKSLQMEVLSRLLAAVVFAGGCVTRARAPNARSHPKRASPFRKKSALDQERRHSSCFVNYDNVRP